MTTVETSSAESAPAPAEAIHDTSGAAFPAEYEPAPELAEVKRALEAVLLAANEPLQPADLKKIFKGQIGADTLRILLEELRADWADRSIELTLVANGWRFRVKPEFQKYIDRLNPEKPPRYSRAVMETLAIVAYRQPATRGDIEDIRGVTVSPGILKALEERGWIDVVGNKEVPGRPELFATTRRFLDDLNLRSLEELPPLHELQATLDLTAQPVFPVTAPLPLLADEESAATHRPDETVSADLSAPEPESGIPPTGPSMQADQ